MEAVEIPDDRPHADSRGVCESGRERPNAEQAPPRLRADPDRQTVPSATESQG